MGVIKVAIAGSAKGYSGGAESSIIEVGVKLGKLGVDWEEIFVQVKANVPIGNHEAFEGLKDMVLIGAAARGPMGKAASSEGDDPGSHIVPYGCETPVISGIVVRRRGVKWVEIDMGQCAVSAETEGQGGKVVGVDVGEFAARRATRGEEGFEAGIDDQAIECSKGPSSPFKSLNTSRLPSPLISSSHRLRKGRATSLAAPLAALLPNPSDIPLSDLGIDTLYSASTA